MSRANAHPDARADLVAAWAAWPDDEGWAQLAARDRLEDLEPERVVSPAGGRELAIELPVPSISLVELVP